ncbi:hypothetical protein Bpfe_012953 [Biomphalaria pfeifferi]|uniref:Uncharacterized protein n=1 Tax=Biomphalaria pfeifferi TaxID=112525 RepID=A0AAD8FBH0_BIOPF|nr:hypothetical protein Bpfe_012953 [Biomphalaria pfeifferi]
MDNPRLIFKPPRHRPGDLQTLPTHPLLFLWPMNAYVRSRIISEEHCLIPEATSLPYKSQWQFQSFAARDTTHPDFVDLRGGPANLKNVTEYAPRVTPFPERYKQDEKPKSLFEECDYVVKLNKEKRLNDKWMQKFGRKYFYIVDDMVQKSSKNGHRSLD